MEKIRGKRRKSFKNSKTFTKNYISIEILLGGEIGEFKQGVKTSLNRASELTEKTAES